ncbi:hypothetical protein QBC35DRAFT_119436 [Podospora australis]|uniref:DUF6594 domain-containing protein n=1 Tax=Podospora australis TaxID=1536484 RepID=A0AAN6WK42_9PEZI|nr:hypothetical protein QBC35DRAFT_119436 [Podospora australis]
MNTSPFSTASRDSITRASSPDQVEILRLEGELAEIVKRGRKHPERNRFHESWLALSYKDCHELGARDHIILVERLKERLEEYNQALLQLAQIAQLNRPYQGDVEFVREWLTRHDGGDSPLTKPSRFTWEEENEYHLVGTRPRVLAIGSRGL